MPDAPDARASLPQLDALTRSEAASDARSQFGHRVLTRALREELDPARLAVGAGEPAPTTEELVALAVARIRARRTGGLQRVVNATGVVLHTNLGRAPLSQAARRAVADAAGYSDLELDLDTGRRGSRAGHVGALVAELTGAEAATVVTNGAAALVLVLAALARDRAVVVSRGELVEIGGSYRLPDVMEAAGARLVEVGTTNRTRLADHRAAVDEDTALLLKVHRSNFRIVGFTEEASPAELATLARETGVPFVHDLGSGLVRDAHDGPLAGEPSIEGSLRAGADLVIVSGDKLLGGPQAGIVVGRAELVERCRRHPLARAMRIDKLQRAALEATLAAHLRDDVPMDVPAVAMVHADPAQLEQRARWMAEQLGEQAVAAAVDGVVGGGALPGATLSSWAVRLVTDDADALAAALRATDPPVIGRIDHDAVLLDLRTVPPASDADLVDLLLDVVP